MHCIRIAATILLILIWGKQLLANFVTVSIDTENLNGKWLLETAELRELDQLEQVWSSVVSVSANHFAISRFLAPSKELRGKIRFDPNSNNHLDIEIEELDLSDIDIPAKIEAAILRGIFRTEGEDAVTIAVSTNASADRPTEFISTESVLLLRLRRAPKDFGAFPREITIHIESAEGTPAAGAIAARFHSKRTRGMPAKTTQSYSGEMKADAEGVVVVPYNDVPRLFIDPQEKQIALPKFSPSLLANGKTIVRLAPACKVGGSLVCEELTKGSEPIGWTNVYLDANGTSVADCSSEQGEFDFLVPAGEYNLEAYGGHLGRKRIRLVVSPNQSQITLAPIAMKALGFVLLKGKPAPEFVDVIGWSGKPSRLADLRGRYVLVDFWGYWCGPCVEAMPILIELHAKYSSKGLAIVGVHVDPESKVGTAEKLKEKTAHFINRKWQGKDLPFPNALVFGDNTGEINETRQQGGTVGLYGVQAFPTTILIDRQGNVVGKFPIRDIQQASEQIQKLLE